MAVDNYKIVDFVLCTECKYNNKKEDEEPCHSCLAIPARLNSIQPEYFERASLGLGKVLGDKSES